MNSTDTVIKPLQVEAELEPTHFGKYVVQKIIGKGAMGAVYKAYDPSLNVMSQLKRYHQTLYLLMKPVSLKHAFYAKLKLLEK